MRSDLNKQLCERERVGSSNSFHDFRHDKYFAANVEYDDEDRYDSSPSAGAYRESMKLRYKTSWEEKNFNENLNPLWGAIRKNVGRPWDKVYSDICKVFDKRSVINQHILIHLYGAVEVKTYLGTDNKIYTVDDYGVSRILDERTEYYVHPKTRILCKNKKFRSYRSAYKASTALHKMEALQHTRVIDDTTSLKKMDGVWYEVTYAIVPDSYEYADQKVKYFRSEGDTSKQHTYMTKKHIPGSKEIASKRTLNKKELMMHGCRND